MKAKKVHTTNESRQYVDKLFSAVADLDINQISQLIDSDLAKFFVYSTYAKSYISKISTTYGDILDSTIYLNKFILSSYPQIILYKQGPPFESRVEQVNSGYRGALKMTLLEELIHSTQDNLHDENKTAVITGGAQGFGLDIAKTFLNSGAKVFIWDIDKSELSKAVKEIDNKNLDFNVVDVSKFEQVKDAVDKISANNNIDILVKFADSRATSVSSILDAAAAKLAEAE